jgi:hypothetical protein
MEALEGFTIPPILLLLTVGRKCFTPNMKHRSR